MKFQASVGIDCSYGVSEWGITNLRDLFSNPFKSEEEILEAADAGQVRLVNTFKNVDCPLVKPRENDIIINLNEGFPLCD